MKTKNGFMPALSNLLAKHGSLTALLLMMIIASVIYPEFRTMRNITNVLRQMSMVGLSAIGMTFVIISGGIDLSIGATIALSGIMVAKLSGTSVLLALVVPLLVGAVIGLTNAFIVTRLRVVPFIATLAVQMAVRGVAYVITNMQSVPVTDVKGIFTFIGRGYVLGIPFPVLVFALVAVVAAVISTRTAYGRSTFAIGGNENAARMMGIRVERSKRISFTATSVLSALAGIILSSRLGAGQPLGGQGWEMDAIAGVAIGGTLLSGGTGGVGKTVCGVLIMSFIKNIINLQGNVNSYWQNIIMGMIILVVIIIQNRGKTGGERA